MRKNIFLEAYHFVRLHLYDLLLLIPCVFIYTVIHEAIHALAVLSQGGEIIDFSVLPSNGKWGYVTYTFANHITYDHFIISIAPYLFSLLLIFIAINMFLCQRRITGISLFKAKIIFLWLFCVPVFDLLYVSHQYVSGTENDLFYAFHTPGKTTYLFIAIFFGLLGLLGYYMQKKLYKQSSLSIKSYLLLCGLGFVLLCHL